MHFIDHMEDDNIQGWVSGDSAGRPATIVFECAGVPVKIFASLPRPDVFDAGYTLFSGFNVRCSSEREDALVKIYVEGKQYQIKARKIRNNDFSIFDFKLNGDVDGVLIGLQNTYSLVFGWELSEPTFGTEIGKKCGLSSTSIDKNDVTFKLENAPSCNMLWVNSDNQILHWF